MIQDLPLQYFQASGELASHCHGSIEKVERTLKLKFKMFKRNWLLWNWNWKGWKNIDCCDIEIEKVERYRDECVAPSNWLVSRASRWSLYWFGFLCNNRETGGNKSTSVRKLYKKCFTTSYIWFHSPCTSHPNFKRIQNQICCS